MSTSEISRADILAMLAEMGIESWQLAHPERLIGYVPPSLDLPEQCKLLLVTPECPQGKAAEMFARVLKSIHLDLEQARQIEPHDFATINQHQLTWIWFAGCDVQTGIEAQILQTPALDQIDGNNTLRRDLWQQICSYQ